MVRKPFGFWKNKENVIEALTPLITKLGYIPSLTELKKINSGLARAINRYYPIQELYKWFGKEDEYKFKNRKPIGYWKNYNNIVKAFDEIIQKVGSIPSAYKLIELGYQDLVSALSRHNIKITDIRRSLGREDENKLKDRSEYANINLIYKEIDEYIVNYGEVPTVNDLRVIDKDYIIKAIYRKKQTTFNEILKQMGYEENKKENGYWEDKDNIINTAKMIIKEFGYLPSQRELSSYKKYQSFCQAVSNYYSGFHKLRETLGLKQLKKEQGYWQDEQQLLDELEVIIERFGHIPTYLGKRGYGYLFNALQKHGGVYVFAKKYNLPLESDKVPTTFYDNEERLEEKVKDLLIQFGYFPSQKELHHHGEYAVVYRLCEKYGNVANASLAYGYEINKIKALDGHFCDSFSERIVDDYLYCCNVSHERNIKICLDNVNVVPDFLLSSSDKVVIEVLMCDYYLPPRFEMEEVYVKRYLVKRKAYLDNGYQLIEVFPNDLRSKKILDEKLYELIKPFSNSTIKDLSKVPLSYNKKRPPGYWRIFENVKKELLPYCKELGRIPTQSELKKFGLGSI